MKLREHPALRDQWPPVPQSTDFGSNKSPVGDVDVLEWVLWYPPAFGRPASLVLRTRHRGRNYARDLQLDDTEFGEQLIALLKRQIGLTVGKIGELECDFERTGKSVKAS